MKFFLDANIPYSALEMFKGLDLEAVHARDIQLSRAGDKEIADYALKNKSILVTKDLELANIRIFPAKHHGLIVVRLPYFFKAFQFVNVLRTFLLSIDLNALENSIAIVKLGRYRIKKLPK